MSVYTLDIDSSERDPTIYPDPGDYVIELKNPIYDIRKISLASARIHASQLLINDRNNTFTVTNTTDTTVATVTLDNGNYKGTTLATELATKLTTAVGESVTVVYDSNDNTLKFDAGSDEFRFDFYGGTKGFANATAGYTTPHDILGFPPSNVASISTVITSGSINLQGPDALILKLSSGSEEFNKTVYSDTPFYTGRILMCGDVINYSGKDDVVEHNFDTGTQASISKLRVQFFYSSNNQLIPYDFRNANHIIKLSIECSRDKLSVMPIVKMDEMDVSLPPPMRIPEFEDPNRWNGFIYIFLIVITGMFFIILTKPRRISE